MNNDNDYKAKLLKNWEATYKKGQLSFWLLLSLKDQPVFVSEIKDFIETVTKGTISCEGQSLYRALRKFYDLEIVDFELRKGNKGPDRKYYSLTPIGKELLHEFTQRNISLFYEKKVADLVNNKTQK